MIKRALPSRCASLCVSFSVVLVRLALVGLDGSRLEIVAQSNPIGRTNRWLNPVGVADLDDDEAEIAALGVP